MSVDQPTRRVIALAPMPPEKSAYALARYSRSSDSSNCIEAANYTPVRRLVQEDATARVVHRS